MNPAAFRAHRALRASLFGTSLANPETRNPENPETRNPEPVEVLRIQDRTWLGLRSKQRGPMMAYDLIIITNSLFG